MKKILVLAMASVMTLSFGMLSACVGPLDKGGVNDDGTIDGTYEEVTKEDLSETLSAVTVSTMIGDTEAAGWALHLGAKAGGEISVTIGSGAAATGISAAFDADGAFSLNKDEETDEILPLGISLGINECDLSITGADATQGSAQGSVYLAPDGTVYADLNLKSGEDELALKGKETLSSLAAFLGGMMPGPSASAFAEQTLPDTGNTDGSQSVQIADVLTIGTIVEMLAQYDVKAELDDSDGYVFRFTASYQALASILGETGSVPVSFTEGSVTLYLSLDESYALRAVSAVADLTGSMEASAATSFPGITFDADVTLSLSVKEQTAVEVPSDLDSYTKGIIEQLFGSAPMPGIEADTAL